MQLTSCVTCSNSPGISGSFFSFVQWVSWTRVLVDSGRKVLDSNIPSIFCRFSCVLSLVVSSQKNRWDDFQSSTESVNPPGRASPQGPQHMGEPKVPSGTSTVRSWGTTVKEVCLVMPGESEDSGYGLLKSEGWRDCTLLCSENTRCGTCGQQLKLCLGHFSGVPNSLS